MHRLCEQQFHKLYGKDPEGLSFSPYRVCPIGAHSDHNLGKITGFAIDQGIHFAYRPKENGVVELTSLQFRSAHSGISPPCRTDKTTGQITCAAQRGRLQKNIL